jgi:integrase
MSVRWKNGRPIVEIYDPITKRKQHVKARDHGLEAPAAGASRRALERFAADLERAALNARDQRRPGTGDETVGSFAERWTRDYPRGESTNKHNAERVRVFAKEHRGRTLRSITRAEARIWANANPSRLPAVRAMFSDAAEDGLCETNPFARLGHKQSKGGKHKSPLTRDELHEFAQAAVTVHGEIWGPVMRALILTAAYTCMREGEICAMRRSLIRGDEYDLQLQFNSALGRETDPKYGSAGTIYLPAPAREAIASVPPVLGSDLIFHGKRGQQLRQESIWRAFDKVRTSYGRLDVTFHSLRHFGATYMLNVLGLEPWVIAEQLRHTDGGVLVVQLYGHPDAMEARERIRRAYGENVRSFRRGSGEDRGTASGGTA